LIRKAIAYLLKVSFPFSFSSFYQAGLVS